MVATILSGAAALGSAIVGAIQSSKQNKEARQLIQDTRNMVNESRADNRAWYNIRYNQDYTQRADAQAILTKQRELLEQQARNAAGTAAVAGSTDEAAAVAKAAANDSIAKSTSDMAAAAESYKQGIENAYRQQEQALDNQEMNIMNQQANMKTAQANATAQAAAQAVNAGVNLMGIDMSNDAAKAIEKMRQGE